MQDTVLVLTNSEDDPHTAPVLKNLQKMGQKVFRLDTDKINTGELKIEFSLTNNSSGFYLNHNGKELDSDSVKSVWYRRPNFFNLQIVDPVQRGFAEQETSSFLDGLWYGLSNVFWLSNPWHIDRARKKILQLNLAQSIGFRVPRTVVTNNPETIMRFYHDCNGKIVFKSINQGFLAYEEKGMIIPTTLLTEKHLEKVGLIQKTPGLFQEFVNKSYDLRVTIVGQKIFATKIYSQLSELTRVDWRNPRFIERLKFESIEIPSTVENYCLKMLQELGLKFGAFDFAVDELGECFFLEINPNGQWQFIEYFTGACISEAIADILVFNSNKQKGGSHGS